MRKASATDMGTAWTLTCLGQYIVINEPYKWKAEWMENSKQFYIFVAQLDIFLFCLTIFPSFFLHYQHTKVTTTQSSNMFRDAPSFPGFVSVTPLSSRARN